TLRNIAGEHTCDRRETAFKVGKADITVIRSGTIEKAAVTHMSMFDIVPPEATEPIDYMVFQVEIFPESPLCPMGHFNTEWSLSGDGPYHMNLDLFPAVADNALQAPVKVAMDELARKYRIDPQELRTGLDEHYMMDHWETPLSAGLGCKLMHLKDAQLDLFIEAYHTFFEHYADLLRANIDKQASAEQQNQKHKRNGKWIEYLTLKDVAVKMGLAAGLPPEAIIKLSFPPNACF
ncbi:MAG: hypothetical protein GY868_16230, partial [Deltaproteobacteria bacterium]|nr:hypothetical protein [Deltaproteobacteria bacterium]